VNLSHKIPIALVANAVPVQQTSGMRSKRPLFATITMEDEFLLSAPALLSPDLKVNLLTSALLSS
jgi:hypothetical protein